MRAGCPRKRADSADISPEPGHFRNVCDVVDPCHNEVRRQPYCIIPGIRRIHAGVPV